ncbi:MAG: hypothetical protein O3C21_20810 [Verrucomicrobia bacterium]|nr:hypothetical protein [Verrucomicrobiota bacterium]
MTAYTKPILRFGLITPLVFNVLLLGAVAFGYNKLSGIRSEKMARYDEQTLRLRIVNQLEAQLAPKRPQFEDQVRLLKADQRQLFTRILDEMQKKYEVIELDRSSLVVPAGRGALGVQAKCELLRLQSTFRGGIGPMQETLLQLDALMPQAVVEEMKMTRRPDPNRNRFDHLELDVTHTCWKAEEGTK